MACGLGSSGVGPGLHPTRHFRPAAVVVVLLALAAGSPAVEPHRPNVVLIVADDLNNDLPCYGSRLVQAPALDRLAARSVRFDRAYCQYPVCNPSRVSLLSGLRPTTTGVFDNETGLREKLPDTEFLAQRFRRQGYRTLKVGKIFHTGDKFEDPRSWDVDIREMRTAKAPDPAQIVGRRGEHGIVLEADDPATWDGFVARAAVELLDDAKDVGRPFFLALGFRRPHTPYLAPRRYHELYPSSSIPPIDEPAEHLPLIPRVALTYDQDRGRLTPEARPDAAGAYYASVTFMDAQLGLLLDAIEHRGLWDDTIVVFLSDHGYHLGEHGGLWHKNTLFEASCRVPLLVAAPGAARGASPQIVELIDLYPTLCDLCGVAPPEGLEGRSLRSQLEDPRRADDRPAFTVVSRGRGPDGHLDAAHLGRSVRTPRWRYTEWFDGSRELYDHDADPHEQRNLARDPQWQDVADECRGRLGGLADGSR